MLNLNEILIRQLIKELIEEEYQQLEPRHRVERQLPGLKYRETPVPPPRIPGKILTRQQSFQTPPSSTNTQLQKKPKSDFENFKLMFDSWWKTQDQNNFESASQIYTSFIDNNREKLEIEKINSIRSEVKDHISSKLPYDKRQNLHEKNRKYFIRRSRS